MRLSPQPVPIRAGWSRPSASTAASTSRRLEVALVALAEGGFLGRVRHRHELRERGRAVVVAQVQEHVRDRGARAPSRRPRAAAPPPPCSSRRGRSPRQHDLRLACGQHERRRGQVALDRLDRVAEEPEPRLAGAERWVDDAARGACAEGRAHGVSMRSRSSPPRCRRRSRRGRSPGSGRRRVASASEPAAVDREDDAVDVVRGRRGEEDGRSGEVSGSPQRPAGIRASTASLRAGSSCQMCRLSVVLM